MAVKTPGGRSSSVGGELAPPEALNHAHTLAGFDCGEPALDDWLLRRAMANQLNRASRTFVVADENRRVVGYYAMAAGAVSHQEATGAVRCNMPDAIPVLVLGRLAVERSVQGRKLGAAMLRDAVMRAAGVARNAGVRALLVHALNDRARAFYSHYGFQPSPMAPMTLMLRLAGK